MFRKNREDFRNIAIFLDRDGTIIEDKNYLSDPDQITLIPNTITALQLLKNNGFKLILTTNQSGISRGYFSRNKLKEIHDKLVTILGLNRIKLDGIYFCPHHPDKKCFCRKPSPGMALGAKKKFHLNLKKSYAIGDRMIDVEFARNFGGKGILVLTGHGKEEESKNKADYVAKDLLDAAQWITKSRFLRNRK